MKIEFSKKTTKPVIIQCIVKQKKMLIPDFSADAGDVSIRYENNKPTIYIGMGESDQITPAVVRTVAAKTIQKAADAGHETASIVFPSFETENTKKLYAACLEGLLLGAYSFSRYKTEPPRSLKSLECVGCDLGKNAITAITCTCENIYYVRDLVNENASIITPARIAHEAEKLKKLNARVTVLTEKEIIKEGMGLLAAVGQGSSTPPRLVHIEYRGNKQTKNTTAIVGKGITFDSGGQNLKTSGNIETMRCDMAGAATVLGIMRTLCMRKPKINVLGVIATAHNAIGERAYFPGDVYRSYSGKTVEIANTDAEGRLVLADAIGYTVDRYAPSKIIDLATLTGGILIALADVVAGLFSNNDKLAHGLFTAGERTNERLWRFPIYNEYRDSLKSDIADLRNTTKFKKGWASSITGAAFIEHFVKKTPWAHIDIAGTAFNEGDAKGEIPRFATGFGVRLILDYLLGD